MKKLSSPIILISNSPCIHLANSLHIFSLVASNMISSTRIFAQQACPCFWSLWKWYYQFFIEQNHFHLEICLAFRIMLLVVVLIHRVFFKVWKRSLKIHDSQNLEVVQHIPPQWCIHLRKHYLHPFGIAWNSHNMRIQVAFVLPLI